MAPKREAPLPGDDHFGGDYSDEKRKLVSRSDGARKRAARAYTVTAVPPAYDRRDLPEFDRLRALREIEIRRRAQGRGEGSSSADASSSSTAPGLPPPEGYDPEQFGVSLQPDDFVSDDILERVLAATEVRSKHADAEKATDAKIAAEVNEGLLQQAIIISQLPPVIDLVTDSEDSDEE